MVLMETLDQLLHLPLMLLETPLHLLLLKQLHPTNLAPMELAIFQDQVLAELPIPADLPLTESLEELPELPL